MSIQESIDNIRKFREEWGELNDTDPDQIYAVNGAPLRPDDLDVVLAVAQTAIQSPTLMGESIQRFDTIVQNWQDVNRRQKQIIDRMTKRFLAIRSIANTVHAGVYDLNVRARHAIDEIKKELDK